ncbi:MAG: DUF305 domain-containing protein [Gemmatimonadetes bacterium]|nr:DUF305 domain-containing protein [Gemmatimonadota bacterium]
MKAPLPFALLVAVLLAPGWRPGPGTHRQLGRRREVHHRNDPHHAQAVQMGRWAPTHGASAALKRFAERIVVAQRDEIAAMRTGSDSRASRCRTPTPPMS